jgi:hypothetical protein
LASLFLSHSSVDNAHAERVRRELLAWGHQDLFLDFDPAQGIPAGRDWEQELYLQVKKSAAMLVLCSETHLASKWCFAEVALTKAMGKPLFPVIVSPCKLPDLLKDYQAPDLPAQGDAAFLDDSGDHAVTSQENGELLLHQLGGAGDDLPTRLAPLLRKAEVLLGRNLTREEQHRYLPGFPYEKTFGSLPGPDDDAIRGKRSSADP